MVKHSVFHKGSVYQMNLFSTKAASHIVNQCDRQIPWIDYVVGVFVLNQESQYWLISTNWTHPHVEDSANFMKWRSKT